MRVGIGMYIKQSRSVALHRSLRMATTNNYNTGLLAQRTNIGTYDRDQFTMVPEFGLTLGYQLTSDCEQQQVTHWFTGATWYDQAIKLT